MPANGPTFPRYLRSYVRAAQAAGWRVEGTRNGHVRFSPPDRTVPPVIAASTPSDCRAERNMIAALRRAGLDLPR